MPDEEQYEDGLGVLESEFVDPDEVLSGETGPDWLAEEILEERVTSLENSLRMLEARVAETFKHAGFKF